MEEHDEDVASEALDDDDDMMEEEEDSTEHDGDDGEEEEEEMDDDDDDKNQEEVDDEHQDEEEQEEIEDSDPEEEEEEGNNEDGHGTAAGDTTANSNDDDDGDDNDDDDDESGDENDMGEDENDEPEQHPRDDGVQDMELDGKDEDEVDDLGNVSGEPNADDETGKQKDDGSDNDENDSDSEDDDDDDSASASSSSSDEDDDNDNDGGISDYERLRLERIKRNQERLAQLGLDGNSKMMAELKAKGQKKKSNARKRPPQPVVRVRKSIGRSSKKRIDYARDVDIRLAKPSPAKKPKQQIPSKPVGMKKQRTPRFIHDEFRRIVKQRKLWIRQLKKQYRQAQKEQTIWSRKAQQYQYEQDRKNAMERLEKQHEQERKELGTTKVALLQDIDARTPELYKAVFQYDRERMEQQRKIHLQLQSELDVKRRQLLEQKMEMIDALDRFPKALKDAMSSLNSSLYNRSPKDQKPPPRRGRSSDAAEIDASEPERTPSTPTTKNHKKSTGATKKKTASATAATTKTPPKKAGSKKNAALKNEKKSVQSKAAEDDEGPSVDVAPLTPSSTGPAATMTAAAALKQWKQETEEAAAAAIAPAVSGPILPGEQAHAPMEKKGKKKSKIRFQSTFRHGWRSSLIGVKISWTNEHNKKVALKKPVPAKLPASVVPRTIWGTSIDLQLKVRVESSKRPFGPFRARLPHHLLVSSTKAKSMASKLQGPTKKTTKNGKGKGKKKKKGKASFAADSATITPIKIRGVKPAKRAPGTPVVRNVPGTGVRNVGGPISPQFAKEIDRTWLEHERPRDEFDLSSYVPQVGDTVLYYPSAHFAFLESYPDILGQKTKSQVRIPLWKRAIKEKQKKRASTGGDNSSTKTTTRNWSTEPWAQAAQKATYPIICRVEKTHAEFPPDPYASYREVASDGTVTWKIPPKKKYKGESQRNSKTPMRLAVALKPLTPVLPPLWDNALGFGVDNEHGDGLTLTQLGLPPNFSVVTFPDGSVDPFLVPFGWAYCLSNSVSIGDPIKVRSNLEEEHRKGKVVAFQNLGPNFGSFRLEDKFQLIHKILASLKNPEDIEKVVGGKGASLSLADTTNVVEFLRKYIEGFVPSTNDDVEGTDSSLSTNTQEGTIFDLVRSTLPLHKGIGVIRNLYHRQTLQLSRWDLAVMKNEENATNREFNEGLIPGIERGLLGSIENALRVKIVCTLQEFIENKKALALFMHNVTKKDYACIIPGDMYLSRILSRLNCVGKRCFYTSANSILADIQAIGDNCVIYNGPDSDQVALCNALLPTMKRLISDVYDGHMKKRKEEEERRLFVLRNCDASALAEEESNYSKRKNASLMVIDGFTTPFKSPIDRRWIQGIESDGSLAMKPNGEGAEVNTDLNGWVPQNGDSILYSRSLHSVFVKGHFNSLSKEQCILPKFQTLQKISTKPDDGPKGNGESKQGQTADAVKPLNQRTAGFESLPKSGKQENADAAQGKEITIDVWTRVLSSWLVGTVVSVRYSFPRAPDVKDGEEESFESPAPILVIGLRFPYEWSKGEVHEICWRPCKLLVSDTMDSVSVASPSEICRCKSCGLSGVSFLRPGWIPVPNNEGVVLQNEGAKAETHPPPSGIDSNAVRSICKCIELLKRRCLEGVSPDFVDSKFCMDIAKGAQSSTLTRTTVARHLPTFEELLHVQPLAENLASLSVSTRGVRKSVDTDFINTLGEMGFLPMWSSRSIQQDNGKKTKDIPKQDMLMPFPSLCLELILLRLRKGYYRQLKGVVNDLNEAYVTSVLYLMNGPANRRKNRISVRKITTHLKAKINNQVSTYVLGAKKKKSKKLKIAELANSPALPPPPPASKNDETAEQARTKALSVFTDEEKDLIAHIEKIRKLYATAIASVSETRHTERVFGLAHKGQVSSENRIILPPPGSLEDRQSVAVRRIRFLLSAVTRDPCQNRFNSYGYKNIRIECNGERILPEENVDQQTRCGASAPVAAGSQGAETGKIRLGWSELEKNDDLARSLFGRQQRMYPCVRCQVFGLPFITCRVRRGHSNPDFGFVENFKNFGGVDGLLRPLLYPDTPEPEVPGQDDNGNSELASPNKAEPGSGDKGLQSNEQASTQEVDTSKVHGDNFTDDTSQEKPGSGSNAMPKWFIAKENDTPRKVANMFGVDCKALIEANNTRWPGIQASSRLKEGTKLRVSRFDKQFDDDDASEDEAGANDMEMANKEENRSNAPAGTKENEDKKSDPNQNTDSASSDETQNAEQVSAAEEDKSRVNEGSTSQPDDQSQAGINQPGLDSKSKWFVANENDTPRMIANVLGIDCQALVDANSKRWPGIQPTSRLRNGTKLRVSEFDKGDGSEDEAKTDTKKEASSDGENAQESTAVAAENQASEVGKPTPVHNFEKAQSALQMAAYLYKQAQLLVNAPIKLSDNFIKASFPVDPEDGKYTYCIICGLSGNVLCCDNDGCPNVVHTHCVGLKRLPDNDWFCAKCATEKGIIFSEQGGNQDDVRVEDAQEMNAKNDPETKDENMQVPEEIEDSRSSIDRVARHTLRDLMGPVDKALEDLGWNIERRSGKKHHFPPGDGWDSHKKRLNTVTKLMDFLKSDSKWQNHEVVKTVLAAFDAGIEEAAPPLPERIEASLSSENVAGDKEVAKPDAAKNIEPGTDVMQTKRSATVDRNSSNDAAKTSTITIDDAKPSDEADAAASEDPKHANESQDAGAAGATREHASVADDVSKTEATAENESPAENSTPTAFPGPNLETSRDSPLRSAGIPPPGPQNLPTKPKMPMSAYNIFFKDQRSKINGDTANKEDVDKEIGSGEADNAKETMPDGKVGLKELAAIVGQRWKELPPEELGAYKKKAEEEMKIYETAKEAWEKEQLPSQSQNPNQPQPFEKFEQPVGEESAQPRFHAPSNLILDSISRHALGKLMEPVDRVLLELGWTINKKHAKKRYNAPGSKTGSRLNTVTRVIEFLKSDPDWKYHESVRMVLRDFDAAILKQAPPGWGLASTLPENRGPDYQSQQHPQVPKRAMSAHFAFANERRAAVKAANPACSNGEISKILSEMWAEAPDDVKKKYREGEAKRWAAYHEALSKNASMARDNGGQIHQASNPDQANVAQSQEQPDNNLTQANISDTEFDEKATELSIMLNDLLSYHPPKPSSSSKAVENGGDQSTSSGKKKRGRPRKNPVDDEEEPKKKRSKDVEEDDEHGIHIGSVFTKNFEGMGDFKGKVVRLPAGPDRPYYKVVYEDGDEEELELSELLPLLDDKKQTPPSAATPPGTKPKIPARSTEKDDSPAGINRKRSRESTEDAEVELIDFDENDSDLDENEDGDDDDDFEG